MVVRSFGQGPCLLRQYTAVIAVNLSSFCTGLGLGWNSPVIFMLKNKTNPVLLKPITEDEGSWIVSLPGLLGFFCTFLPPILMSSLGSKFCLIFCCFMRIIASCVTLFATEVWLLMLGRGVTGIIDIIVMCVIPTYTAEIASTSIRGALGTIIHIFTSLGILMMFSMGPYVSYFNINLINTCICVVCTIPVMFVPDSPYFLYSKGKKEDSLKVLKLLRGSENWALEEINEYEPKDERPGIKKCSLFRNKLFLKSVALTVIFCVGTELGGHTVIMFYLQTILESTGTNIKSDMASVIVGSIQLLSCFFTLVVTDHFGRKPLLMTSFLGDALGLFGLGAFFLLKNNNFEITSGFINYMPLLSLIIYLFANGLGIGALSFIVASELYEAPARGIGMAIVFATKAGSMFLITKFFAHVIAAIGATATFWMLSIFCVLYCLFVLNFIPETKGRTFSEIQNIMARTKVKVVSRL